MDLHGAPVAALQLRRVLLFKNGRALSDRSMTNEGTERHTTLRALRHRYSGHTSPTTSASTGTSGSGAPAVADCVRPRLLNLRRCLPRLHWSAAPARARRLLDRQLFGRQLSHEASPPSLLSCHPRVAAAHTSTAAPRGPAGASAAALAALDQLQLVGERDLWLLRKLGNAPAFVAASLRGSLLGDALVHNFELALEGCQLLDVVAGLGDLVHDEVAQVSTSRRAVSAVPYLHEVTDLVERQTEALRPGDEPQAGLGGGVVEAVARRRTLRRLKEAYVLVVAQRRRRHPDPLGQFSDPVHGSRLNVQVDFKVKSTGSPAASVNNSNMVANESGRFTGSGVPAFGPNGIPAAREIAHSTAKVGEVATTPTISFLGGGG